MRQKFLTLFVLVAVIAGAIFMISSPERPEFNEKKLASETEEKGPSDAYKALNFLTRARAFPEPDVPPAKFFQAFTAAKQMLQKPVFENTTNSSWKPMGPWNVPGRMISVAVNPQNSKTLYAGSASGGLWRTFDASKGSHWEQIRTEFPVLGVMAIAIDPADTNVMYIGTGEVYGYQRSIGGVAVRTTRGSYGLGILKTTDGGQTWFSALDWTQHQERGIQKIMLNPQNSNTIYAATTEGIFKSIDAGNSWRHVLDVLLGEDIVIHATDTNKVLISCGNLGSPNSGIYRSLDGGETWEKSAAIPRFTGKTLLEMYAGDPNVVYASVADSLNGKGLYYTYDFGNSWGISHRVDVPQYQGFFAHWVAIHPELITEIVHAGVNIYKSHSAGKTLSVVSGPHVDHHNYAHDPQNPDVLYIACDGGVYRSDDFGDSYRNIGYGLQTAQFYNGFSTSASDPNLAMGGLQDNNTAIFYGTPNWRLVIGGDGCWTAINQKNDNILYGEYQYNNIYKSAYRGISFSPATNGMTAPAAFVAPYVLSPSHPSILYSGRVLVYKSINAAESWFATNNGRALDGNPVISMAISSTNPNVVYAGTAPVTTRAHIFRTLDGGESWQDVTGALPNRYPMDFAVDPQNPARAFVVFAGYDCGHVFKTTDSGDSWEDVTGNLPDLPTFSVTIDPLNPEHIYLGNDLTVYVSTDGGTNWMPYNQELPEAVIAMDLNISRANRKLWLATHGNGAYQTDLLHQPAEAFNFTLYDLPDPLIPNFQIPLKTIVRNNGQEPQQDTISVKLRVLNPQNREIFSASTDFCCLNPAASDTLIFSPEFTALDTGMHQIEIIKSGASEFQQPDTTRHHLEIIPVPGIAALRVTKHHCPYEEIDGGTALPRGDDLERVYQMPFDFTYDNFVYTHLQISSNGWIEFGAGTSGTLRGLSTNLQLGDHGAAENERLASTSRPTKALGPWWDDLTTDEDSNGGEIRWQTIGTTPNRMLVIQWKNMRAYDDSDSTRTRINFQVRLYETSNIIEFHYGPVDAGTFGGKYSGASIGFKDHLGGNFRFFDIFGGGIHLSEKLNTHSNPLRHWPGPDSCYVIQAVPASLARLEPQMPTSAKLYPNYPNPFNPATTIPYFLPEPAAVELKIFNQLGQRVTTLVQEKQPAGYLTVVWDGRNEHGALVSSGVYFCRFQAGKILQIRKILFVK